MKAFLLHPAESALKGKNRAFFERILLRNIRAKIKGEIEKEFGRFLLRTEEEDALEKLAKIPGIANYSPVEVVEKDWAKIKEKAKELTEYLRSPFKIEAKRSDKYFPLTSPEIEQKLALIIKENFGLRPSYQFPRSTLYVIIGQKYAYLFVKKIKGIGGLPVGASGKAFAFLSGGIDSAVASFLLMKRGVKIEFLHFFNETLNKEKVRDKIRRLIKKLSEYQPETRGWIIPFGEIQKQIIAICPEDLRMILYRRAMFRVANLLAKKRKVKAFVVGDSVGQVASQTLPNLK
ncbi:tRNA 4-thiouridine(8) synthase ThiI, partial [bacterium]|nr:tRNA 4-thiouridine(8) synthase ThiI [bacterium]